LENRIWGLGKAKREPQAKEGNTFRRGSHIGGSQGALGERILGETTGLRGFGGEPLKG